MTTAPGMPTSPRDQLKPGDLIISSDPSSMFDPHYVLLRVVRVLPTMLEVEVWGRKLTYPKLIGHMRRLPNDSIVGQPIAKIGQALGFMRVYARDYLPSDVLDKLMIPGEQWRVGRRIEL